MTAETADEERPREHREQAAPDDGRRKSRARLRRVLPAAAAIVLVIGGLGYAALTGGHPVAPGPTAKQLSAPFGQHYAGLVGRRERAGVPTMMRTMSGPWHVHPVLSIYVNGKRIKVAANIGIDPDVDGMQMAGLHTHDDSGTIHVEGLQHATLAQFMTIWGVPLSGQRLGAYHSSRNAGVRMWVDGKPSQAFGALVLADGQRIVISYGPPRAPQPGS
jgi:hypothetical protein